MNTQKSIRLAIGLSIAAGVWMAAPAYAGPGSGGDNRSYSNITGTNIWNSTAPILEEDFPIDPALIAKVRQVNQDSQAKYQECLDAIAAAEQAAPPATPRQYLRRDPRVPYPQACVDLENLRAEANGLRTKIKEIQDAAASRSYGTW